MAKILSVLALAGDKGAAALAAADDIQVDCVHAVGHGNDKNLKDTLAALREMGATKSGKAKATKAGEVFDAFLSAINAATAARNTFMARWPKHRGKLTPEQVPVVEGMARAIAEAFLETVRAAEVARKSAPVARKAKKTNVAESATAPEAESATAPEAESATAPEAESATAPEESPLEAAMRAAINAVGEDAVLSALLKLAEPAQAVPAKTRRRKAA